METKEKMGSITSKCTRGELKRILNETLKEMIKNKSAKQK